MNCNKARRILSDRLEEIMAGKSPSRLADHLESCGGCARELRALTRAREGLCGLAGHRVPDEFSVRVMARIRAQELPGRSGRFGQAIRWAAIPATAMALMSIWFGTRVTGPSPEMIAERNHRACLRAYAEFRGEQPLGGTTEMMAIASQIDKGADD